MQPLLSGVDEGSAMPAGGSLPAALCIGSIGVAYWYLLVFGAAAAASGLPVPDWLPLVPGWPPSDADLAPVLVDSENFFYLPAVLEKLGLSSTPAATDLPVLRLSLFNFAEAWAFAFLPALLADRKRLPSAVVLFVWLGALALTNAFLAPYLAVREAFALGELARENPEEEPSAAAAAALAARVGGVTVGGLAAAVSAFALGNAVLNGGGELDEFIQLAVSDRTYLAFLVDLSLFGAFQAWLMRDVPCERMDEPSLRFVPFIGLVAWLLL